MTSQWASRVVKSFLSPCISYGGEGCTLSLGRSLGCSEGSREDLSRQPHPHHHPRALRCDRVQGSSVRVSSSGNSFSWSVKKAEIISWLKMGTLHIQNQRTNLKFSYTLSLCNNFIRRPPAITHFEQCC